MSADLGKHYRIARRNLGALILPIFGPSLVRLLARSWKCEVLQPEHGRAANPEEEAGCLLALWHGRMLVGTPFFRGSRFSILVSPSDDGGLMKILLESFGYRIVRGSTSKGGARALRELLGVLRGRGTIAITPDGPRGPRHSMNAGLAWMAKRTGLPIQVCGFACDRAWRMKSWDRFTIPKPGARVVMAYGEALRVGSEADEEELRAATREIHARLLAAEQAGFDHLGTQPDW